MGTNKKDAGKKLSALLLQKSRGELITDAQTTLQSGNGKKDIAVQELAHEHLKWCEINRSKATYALRKNFICLFLRYLEQERKDNIFWVSQLDVMVLEGFISWIRTTRPRLRKAGFEHNRHIKTFLRWGYERELCELPRRFPRIREREPETKRFFENDLQTLLNNLPTDIEPIIKFSVETGLRPFELTDLKKSHIEKNGRGNSSINIPTHKTSDSTKTYRARSIPLSDKAFEIYARETAKHPDSKFIFLNKHGRLFTPDFLSQKLKRLCSRYGIDPKPIYSMRHTCASVMSDNGADIKTVADLLGHSNIRTTTRYIKNNDERHRKAVQDVADFCSRIDNGNGQKADKTDRVDDRETPKK